MKRYLEKVVYCTLRKPAWNKRQQPEGEFLYDIRGVCSDEDAGNGILYITDDGECLRMLKSRKLPAAAWLHEENRDQDLSAAFYAVENPWETDEVFWERAYRREKGIPWDIVETDRCLVREMMPEDSKAFAQMYKDPAIYRYMKDFHGSEEAEARYIQEYQQQYRLCEYGVWSIVLKENGQVIGRVGFSEAEDGLTQERLYGEVYQPEAECYIPQFGYMIGVPWQGQGLAYEVCRAVLEYAKEELVFETVQLWVEECNGASIHLAERLGFQRTAQVQGSRRLFIMNLARLQEW